MEASRFSSFVSAVAKLWDGQEDLKLSSIRLGYMQYFFAFPLAMIFATSQHYLLQGRADMFGLKFITIGVVAFGVGATAFFSMASAKNIALLSRIASLLALAGFVPYLLLPDGAAAFACAVLFMAGIGGCVSLSSFSSGFVLNHAERFMGSVIILLFSGTVRIANELFRLPGFAMPAVMGAVALGLMASTFLCNAGAFAQRGANPGKYNAAIWLVLFLFFSYFMTKSLGIHLEAFHLPKSNIAKGFSVLAAALLCLIAQASLKRGIWTMCNVFFIAAIGCFALDAFGQRVLADVAYGFREIGMVVAFYLIGCATNRFSNFRMHKQLLFIMMPAIVPIYVIPDLLAGAALLYPAAIGISSALFVVFLLLSPVFSKHVFSADWHDSKMQGGEAETAGPEWAPPSKPRQTGQLEEYHLTPREKEIAVLLLQGMEIKQVAGTLNLKFDTVRYHMKNLYKKLNIGSRTELFARFGAAAMRAEEARAEGDAR